MMRLPFPPRGTVFCDVCDQRLGRDVAVEEERLTDDRVGYFFRCPSCRTKYPFASVSKRGKTMLPELADARKALARAKGDRKKYPRLFNRLERMLKAYQKEVGGVYDDTEVLRSG